MLEKCQKQIAEKKKKEEKRLLNAEAGDAPAQGAQPTPESTDEVVSSGET